ncbi:helix-turn-helix domain-containing protein [[Kitasatospora] papulosa]
MFADGRGSTGIAKELRVSVRSVQRWRRSWREAGQDAVRSRGPAVRPKLNDRLLRFSRRSWPKDRLLTDGRTSGGRSPGSRR